MYNKNNSNNNSVENSYANINIGEVSSNNSSNKRLPQQFEDSIN